MTSAHDPGQPRDCSRRGTQRAAATGRQPGPALTAATPIESRHRAHWRRRGGSSRCPCRDRAYATSGRGHRPTGQASSMSGFPLSRTGRWGGTHPPTAGGYRRPAAPSHLSYSGRRGSSTCRYLVDRHPCGDASDPTALRARPSRSPSAGESVWTVQPGARSCTTSDVGHPRPRRRCRGWTPRSRPRHCLPGGFREDTPHAMQFDRRDVVWAQPRCSSSVAPARAGSQLRCTPPVSHRSAMPPPAIRRIEAERGAALAGYVPVTWRSNGALPP